MKYTIWVLGGLPLILRLLGECFYGKRTDPFPSAKLDAAIEAYQKKRP